MDVNTENIKKLFHSGDYPNSVNIALLIMRLIIGGFMLTHGYGKLLMLFGDAPIHFPDPMGIGPTATLALTVFAEFLCSILLITGLLTRFAAIPLLINMAVAGFIVHGHDGFGKQEFALLYASVYLMLLITSAGKFSIDKLIYDKLK